MGTTVRLLLESKREDFWFISPNATVYEGLVIMAKKDIGALLVMEDEKLVGIFSERDYARKVILEGKSSKDMLVHELMTKRVLVVDPDKTVEDCMAIMTIKHIRHLPVAENKKIIGIVTIRDIGTKLITDQKITINDLENYITGGSYGL